MSKINRQQINKILLGAIFVVAIIIGASLIYMMHNHGSGDIASTVGGGDRQQMASSPILNIATTNT